MNDDHTKEEAHFSHMYAVFFFGSYTYVCVFGVQETVSYSQLLHDKLLPVVSVLMFPLRSGVNVRLRLTPLLYAWMVLSLVFEVSPKTHP